MAAQPNGFNDRIYVRVPLDRSRTPAQVTALATADATQVRCKVVGCVTERWAGEHMLHIQVDLESTGYQQGPIRREGATVKVTIFPKDAR